LFGNAAELLDAAQEAFDQVAVAIKITIEGRRGESVRTRRNDSLTASCSDALMI